jgi:hypothetical protein
MATSTVERNSLRLDETQVVDDCGLQAAPTRNLFRLVAGEIRLPARPSGITPAAKDLLIPPLGKFSALEISAIRDGDDSRLIESKPTETRKVNPPNADLRFRETTGLCPANPSRSDLTVQSSRSTKRRQKKECDLTRSSPFEAVRRTLRFSRFNSRRKVLPENEKRNADQRAPARREPHRDC